ncbi:MAG: putative toxin-antitoxin system toxin component, PIN family [Cytophagales bacterium]|nr:putative toxin-antitoxin system toxin component, PIN family [Cytophagales bacterium]
MNSARNKVVLDTNTIISAAINPNSISGALYLYTLTHCDLYRSDATSHELEVVINRPFMDRYFLTDAPQTRVEFVERYFKQAKQVSITKSVTRCADPKDNMFLELVETIGANYLVSGNIKHLNILGEHKGTPIVTNRQFLADVAPLLLMS